MFENSSGLYFLVFLFESLMSLRTWYDVGRRWCKFTYNQIQTMADRARSAKL